MPLLVGALDEDLDERAGQLLVFPRSGRLARPQAHDQVLPPRRLAGAQRDVANDAVALVEDAEHRDPLRHRRDSGLTDGARRSCIGRRSSRVLLLLLAGPARDEAGGEQKRGDDPLHAYSGIHGS